MRLFGPNRSHNLIKHISSALLSFVISLLFQPPRRFAVALSLFAHTLLEKKEEEEERRKKEGYKQSAVEAMKPRGVYKNILA